MLVAAGRIKVDEVHRIHLPEVFHAVAANDARLVESQCGHIVFGQIAQVPLPFHISDLAESARRYEKSTPNPPVRSTIELLATNVSDSGESDIHAPIFISCVSDSGESDNWNALLPFA